MTALELLDREGTAALSMRRLADALDVGTMSLYHYFADKDELSDAVVGLVLTEMHRPAAGEDWEYTVRRVATSFREAALAHPAAIRLMLSRVGAGASYVHWVAVGGHLRAVGMTDSEVRRLFRTVSRFVIGWCLTEGVERKDQPAGWRRPGSDEEFAFGLEALIEAFRHRGPSMGTSSANGAGAEATP